MRDQPMRDQPMMDTDDEMRKELAEIRRRKAAADKPPEAEEKAAEPRIYVVQRGDSLSKIAKEVYGNAGRWKEIFEANRDQIKDPNLIRPGQELRIP